MRRRRQVFCCPPPHSLRECLLLPNSCSQPSYCARMGGAMVVPQRPSDRVRLTIVATALLRVFHLLPIARRSPAATEHDVGGGRRRVAPTGGGSITRSGEFHAGPRCPAKLWAGAAGGQCTWLWGKVARASRAARVRDGATITTLRSVATRPPCAARRSALAVGI